jgi:hypothetical protein
MQGWMVALPTTASLAAGASGEVKGPLAGRRLAAIPHVDAFWFAWAAFNPATSVYGE